MLSLCLILSAAGIIFTAKVDFIKAPPEETTLEVFSDFTPENGSVDISLLGIKNTVTVEAEGEVNTSKIGVYELTYKTGFLFKTKKTVCKVKVVDTVPPKIKCNTLNLELAEGQNSLSPEDINLNYTATDNYDGDLTSKVTVSVKENHCILSVKDSSGNEATHEINIIPHDNEYPKLTLSGTLTYFLHIGAEYKEPGYSAEDNIDGDITSLVQVSNNIDKTKAGEYRVDYKVSDKAGNVIKLTRKVVVYGAADAESFKDIPSNGKAIYLTFDDGPGPYTEELLGYLNRYGVKATFFVTNQNSRYQNMIKRIDEKGHAIGVHTLTHKWSIYKSEENYYNDFNAMQAIIKKQTGKTTNIFRFPGGTNNTVSKKYKGIMTRLSTQMTEQGYYYFDWNVDCNDSRTSDVQRIISDTLQQISKKDCAVVLMHDIKHHTVKAVPAIIEECLREGYTFEVLTEDSPAIRFAPKN